LCLSLQRNATQAISLWQAGGGGGGSPTLSGEFGQKQTIKSAARERVHLSVKIMAVSVTLLLFLCFLFRLRFIISAATANKK